VGVAVLLAASVSTWRDSRREAALQTARLHDTASVLAALSGEAAEAGDEARAFSALRAIRVMPDVLYARVERADGSLLSEAGDGVSLSRDLKLGDKAAASPLALLQSRTVQVSAPIVHGNRGVGKVVLLAKLEGAAARLWASLITGLLAAVLSGGVGLVIAWRLQRRITGPILSLTAAMEGVGQTHDYTRPAIVDADDEVADLARGFNAMLSEIRARDAQIAGHVEGLEATVAERTADLVEAKQVAEAANSAKSDFLATMSHEIRTPMNGIMVMAEMLAAGDVPPRQRRFAEVIAKSGGSLLAIINDILDFSKIEAGKMDLESAPVDPAEIAEDVASLFWERARSKGLDLAAYVDPACPSVIDGDPTRLRQVLGNLVNNAIKFTETGGVLIEITPSGEDRLRLSVRDSGIGIAKDKLGSVFGAFTQADQSTTRKFGGTGLGLAICKRLVDAMGGRLSVASELGVGSVFTVEIPITVRQAAAEWPGFSDGQAALAISGACTGAALTAYLERAGLTIAETARLTFGDAAALRERPDRAEAAVCLGEYGDAAPGELVRDGLADVVMTQPFRRADLQRILARRLAGGDIAGVLDTETRAAAERLPRFSGKRLLVADDSAVNREVALEALSRLGIQASVAMDGREAVAAALTKSFDLILMDGSMPEMDGYEATREIRAREAVLNLPRLPIVALTAHVVGHAADAWREADMDDVLHKPFTLASLAAILGRFLEADPDAPEAPAQDLAAGPAPTLQDPSPTDPKPLAEGLFDPQVTAELAGMAEAGKTDFVERVRQLYRDNAPPAARRVIEAASSGSTHEAALAAHALKSMSLNIGAKAVADLAGRIEARARDPGVVDAALAEALYRRLLETLDALEQPVTSPLVPAKAQNARMPDEEEALAADLHGAAGRGEFSLVYQPQVDRDGVSLLGVECLLRWRHPVRGDVSPALFIPIAERRGLIRDISRWVLDEAMSQTGDLGDLTVGVNASALEFSDPSFIDELAVTLARHRFDPARLEIEITETAVLGDGEEVRRNISRLHELGVKIALDDFGVGYSSLSHLRMFGFDKLKIDRAFVTDCASDMQSATLVHAVVSVGRAMGMKVVAEGIETEAQWKFLKVAGVHALQGYLFGRPEPITALRARLEAARHTASSPNDDLRVA
jgi:EAL domain-containing protein (putative c-di-GMP-specific phosphodiesterase class I)/signal transduction histidine kinase/CheY-like chemotaxis protein/HPt (histidine-containing phosphotransfer) domain-containing protein